MVSHDGVRFVNNNKRQLRQRRFEHCLPLVRFPTVTPPHDSYVIICGQYARLTTVGSSMRLCGEHAITRKQRVRHVRAKNHIEILVLNYICVRAPLSLLYLPLHDLALMMPAANGMCSWAAAGASRSLARLVVGKDVVDISPARFRRLLTLLLALGPELDLAIVGALGLPETLRRVRLRDGGEPPRLVGRELALGTETAGLALLLLVCALQPVCQLEAKKESLHLGAVVLGVLERALVRAQTTVGRAEVLLQALRDVVERDGVWRQVERRLGLLRVLPQKHVLVRVGVDLLRRRERL